MISIDKLFCSTLFSKYNRKFIILLLTAIMYFGSLKPNNFVRGVAILAITKFFHQRPVLLIDLGLC